MTPTGAADASSDHVSRLKPLPTVMRTSNPEFAWQAVVAVFAFIAMGVGVVLLVEVIPLNHTADREWGLVTAFCLLGLGTPAAGLAFASRLRFCKGERDILAVFGRLGVAAALLALAIGATYLSYTYVPVRYGHEARFVLPTGLYLASLGYVAKAMNPPTAEPPAR